ncbi:hypothetical protein MRB53_033003 [Persea americana]|uniref:Uncharacterized protein n=1 Tax=Persea americana TaxID=3435 RepID=A0ACC2KU20_PERAE|nr:hypothetical protein MRB53_033003 [Persea americana]
MIFRSARMAVGKGTERLPTGDEEEDKRRATIRNERKKEEGNRRRVWESESLTVNFDSNYSRDFRWKLKTV